MGQVGARFLAESEIWLAWQGTVVRPAGAVLAEVVVAHMTSPVVERFLRWWKSLPSGAKD